MVAIGVVMLRRRGHSGDPGVECHVERAPKVLGYGLVTGVFSGFFGIGGGFLIVPGLLRSTGMPMINAVGTSLVAVTAFGLTTALNYPYQVSSTGDWPAAFIGGGFVGSALGARAARRLAKETGRLAMIFATDRLRRRPLHAGANGERMVRGRTQSPPASMPTRSMLERAAARSSSRRCPSA